MKHPGLAGCLLLILLSLLPGLSRAGESTSMADLVNSAPDSVSRTFLDWSYDFQDDGTRQIGGRLYVPPGYNPADTATQYPLVVFYHGSSEYGTNNTSPVTTKWADYLKVAAQNQRFFLYLPQASVGWMRPGSSDIENTMLQVANLQRAYRIDREKLYLTGFSQGGNAIWSLGSAYAGALAALFPVEPLWGGLADSGALDLAGRPVWVFYNRKDTRIYAYQVRGRVDQIRAAAGLPAWTYLNTSDKTNNSYFEENGLRYSENGNDGISGGDGHTTQWAYQNGALYTWLLAQRNTAGWLGAGEKVAFDFGGVQLLTSVDLDSVLGEYMQTLRRYDSAGVNWNSTAPGYGTNFGAAAAMAKTAAGRSTFVSLHVAKKFGGDYTFESGEATLFDDGIGKDGWITAGGGTAGLLVQGLTPGARYRVEIFASNTAGGAAYKTSLYQIGGASRTLDVYNNLSNKAVFEAVTADANGQIALSVSGTSGASYGAIGTLELTALPPPPVVTGPLAATGTQGRPFTYQITASNTPASYGATGLPEGVIVNTSTGLISGTPTQSGTFAVGLTAANAGGSGSATLALSVQNPFDAWKSAHFTPEELANEAVSGESACPGGDGIPNLTKYALNLNPRQSGAAGLPKAARVISAASGGEYLSLVFTRNLLAADVDYAVEVSADMKTWNSGDGFTALENVTDHGDGVTQSVTARDLTPMSGASRRFMRLKLIRH